MPIMSSRQTAEAGEWVTVFETNTDYEAEMVRDRLVDSDIPAVLLTRRDHAFQLTVGSLAAVIVRVPQARLVDARAVLDADPIGDRELTRIALAADPNIPFEEPAPLEPPTKPE